MPNTGRKIYPFLKQIDTLTGLPTGVKKANVPEDPDYVPPVVDYVSCPILSWEPIDSFCITTKTCESGWILSQDGSFCQRIQTQSATPPSGNGGTPGIVAKVNNIQWNNGGARIYHQGFPLDGNGTVDASLLIPHFWVNGDTIWSNATRNLVDGRMNAAGIWSQGPTPSGEYIGFSRRITTPSAKRVYVGISGDNVIRITLNGTIILNCQNIEGAPNFNFWNIYPVDLLPGDNYIEVYGMNLGSVAGFGAEIYDMTFEQLVNAQSPDDLNIIFSTANIVGEPFDLGQTQGWSCPSGWVLDTTVAGDPVCRLVSNVPSTLVNTGIKGYANRRRYTSGVLDGYIEPNVEGSGLGPYFPPVNDPINCPLPSN